MDLISRDYCCLDRFLSRVDSHLSSDRNELEAAQKFLEQAAVENLVSIRPLERRGRPAGLQPVSSLLPPASAPLL